MGFLINFPEHGKGQEKALEKPGKLIPGKILQNPSYEENLGNGNLESDGRKVLIFWGETGHQFPSMDAFFPLDSHAVIYFIICRIYGFPHQFPIV